MKKLFHFMLVGFATLFSLQTIANIDQTRIKNSFYGDVISTTESQTNGQFQFHIWYKVLDTISIDRAPEIELPETWSISHTNIGNNTYYPGDSINLLVTIDYPTNNLPFYPEEIQVTQFANMQILDSRDTIYNKVELTAMVYFTPYNIVEIWSLYDFQNLPRNWHFPDNSNKQRIYVDPTDIPASNLDSYTIDWDSGDWENDWQDDFREEKIDGLAYSILMKPVPPDSIEYYSAIGDGADSLDMGKGKTFSGRVTGRLVAIYEDDYGNTITYPLSGIRIKLMEEDLLWNQTFATGYTDINGNFDLSYSENQTWEGNLVELFLRFKSRTSDEYKIRATNFIGSHYVDDGSVWQAPQSGGLMEQGDISMVGDSRFYYDGFRAVHWGNKGYIYFTNNNISLGKKLRYNINATGSYYNPYNVIATISLADSDADHENTPYHEFGHHTMYRLQGNNFTMPYGEDGLSHSWSEENTSKLAWVEGWADFIGMTLDAAYWEEDGEYGQDEFLSDPYEHRTHYSWPSSWNITNGYRSEYYFACALYDLWDGANKNLPTVMPHETYHGWNETNQTGRTWATIDDVEFDFNTLCQPLIQNPSGSGKITNTQMYIDYLVGIVNDCEDIADISRTMQENRVQWNAHEYEWGWGNSNYNTDALGITETYFENPTFPGSTYTDTYDVTIYNKNSLNNFSINSGLNTQCLTDNMVLGIWDTFSNVYKESNLDLNTQNQGSYHRTFNTYGKNRIYIANGTIEMGSSSSSAELNLGSESLLWNRNHGELIINDNSTLNVPSGATLYLSTSSQTKIYGSGKINIESGGYICIQPGATILLSDSESKIIFDDDAIIGTNPDLEVNLSSNCQLPSEIVFTGDGEIVYNCSAFIDDFTHENITIVYGTPSPWSNVNYKFKKDVILLSNAELTISNTSKLEFAKGAKIIVRQGAKLFVDNSILTSVEDCNESWQGIEVWGNSSENQYADSNGDYNQGYVELTNGTKIENAIIAVDLWSPGQWGTQGGMLFATGAVFANNAKSIHALHYSNFHPNFPSIEMDYSSNVRDCIFEITSDFIGDVTFYKHVDLASIRGLDFQGCDFSLEDGVNGVSEWNHGIAAYGAKFSVTAICTGMIAPCPEANYDKSTFTGFYSGIHVLNEYNNPVTFSVNRAVFINNSYGVFNRNVDNASVLFSIFNISENKSSDKSICADAPGIGIYNEAATGFAFEENHFYKYTGAPTGIYKGISINTTDGIDEIYKNYFNGLSYGNYSVGTNWNTTLFNGLAYYCNENVDNYADFYVGNNGAPFEGIQSTQGNANYVAGNKFSQAGSTWHFYNGGDFLVGYYFNQNNLNEEPADGKIHQVTKEGRNVTNSCPSHYGINTERKDLLLTVTERNDAELDYYNSLIDFNNVNSLYNNLVDGGDTEGELIDIKSAKPEDMWDLRSQLLGDSPHLSLEVLKEVADKTDVFTESAIFDILAANPDELKKDTLLSYLENKQNPLPNYMIEILREVASGTTYKTVLQQEMARYSQQYSRAAHDIIRSIMNDTVCNNVDLRNWLDNLGGYSSDRQIISTYINEKDFDNAFLLANLLPQLYLLNEEELIEYNYYMQLINLYHNLDTQNRNTLQLTGQEIRDLELIADNSKGYAGSQSKSILEGAYDYHYYECPSLNENESHKSNIIDMDSYSNVLGLTLSVKPNPAKDWAAFDYTLPDDKTYGEISIVDGSGKIIEILKISGNKGQRLWDIRYLKPGVYTYSLRARGLIKTGKIVITK